MLDSLFRYRFRLRLSPNGWHVQSNVDDPESVSIQPYSGFQIVFRGWTSNILFAVRTELNHTLHDSTATSSLRKSHSTTHTHVDRYRIFLRSILSLYLFVCCERKKRTNGEVLIKKLFTDVWLCIHSYRCVCGWVCALSAQLAEVGPNRTTMMFQFRLCLLLVASTFTQTLYS